MTIFEFAQKLGLPVVEGDSGPIIRSSLAHVGALLQLDKEVPEPLEYPEDPEYLVIELVDERSGPVVGATARMLCLEGWS